MIDMEKAGLSRREVVLGLGGLAVMVTSFAAGEAEANFGQLPHYVVKNDTGTEIYMKLVGHTNDWVCQTDDAFMARGEEKHDDLYPGERWLIVWDRHKRPRACAKVNITNNPGHISISFANMSDAGPIKTLPT